jgi:hypothetical protein
VLVEAPRAGAATIGSSLLNRELPHFGHSGGELPFTNSSDCWPHFWQL